MWKSRPVKCKDRLHRKGRKNLKGISVEQDKKEKIKTKGKERKLMFQNIYHQIKINI